MRYRIRDILLVSSLYDSYIFEEDGRLYELIRKEYQGLDLSHTPEFTHVSTGREAIELASQENRFDLIITTLHVEDVHAVRFAKMVRESGLNIPIVLLAYDNREEAELIASHDISVFERIFIWQGDYRILLGIIKYVEDRLNVDEDTRRIGVQSIILIEDNVKFYSSYLPIIYTEIVKQSQRLISEGVNLSHKYLRMRARPKILLCTTYEEAWSYFEKYEENILGVISDIDFMRGGIHDPVAGIEFARDVKARLSDIPILLQSNDPSKESVARAVGASFILKDSPTLLNELRRFMIKYFSFGDFVFRMPDGTEVGRATDLRSLEAQLRIVPDESIYYHAERNHFSNWLKARTEFWLAHRLRPQKASEFPSIAVMREDLVSSLRRYRHIRQRGQITDFSKETFDPNTSFARIGSGSLGGKARGLGFVNRLIHSFDIRNRFEGVKIMIPPAVVLATDIFDQFIEENNLREFALSSHNDEDITQRFVEASWFPPDVLSALSAFLELIRVPLAVRSSSLLEDSQYHPFAGVYATYMIPNNMESSQDRLNDLVNTIKRVYASTFYQSAKDYIKVTSYRLEEEKMAIIVQRMVGTQHEDRFYPDFAGVARSYNFYPMSPQTPNDGIVSVALGLGKTIVEGGMAVRFCPKYPNHLFQLFSAEEALRHNQSQFYALELNGKPLDVSETHDMLLKQFGLSVAERDGSLTYVASTYSPENDAVYDGLSRPGRRIVTFAPIIRQRLFPLPNILELLLNLGNWGMGAPVEIEFAVNMTSIPRLGKEFGLLQVRPLVVNRELEELNVEDIEQEKLICQSSQVLGNGVINDLYDCIVVDFHKFDRSHSHEVAAEVSRFNEKLIRENRPYLLIGVGRWGTLDPWLGIPVRYDNISGARAIVESGFKDMDVTPSQGSHFFQNITSFMVGYFTIHPRVGQGFIDWDWLLSQPICEEKEYTRHLRFDTPIVIKMNGHRNKGLILKPGA
jgi:CheY-like chemotaxis protein